MSNTLSTWRAAPSTEKPATAVDGSTVVVPDLWRPVAGIHRALAGPDDDLQPDALLEDLVGRLDQSIRARPARRTPPSADAADALPAHLDSDISRRHDPTQIAAELGWSTTHLIRSFTAAFRLPPHQYLIGRRVEAARRRLLAGVPASQVAVDVGFDDQAHLGRHLRRHLATSPGRDQGRRAAG